VILHCFVVWPAVSILVRHGSCHGSAASCGGSLAGPRKLGNQNVKLLNFKRKPNLTERKKLKLPFEGKKMIEEKLNFIYFTILVVFLHSEKILSQNRNVV